MILFHVEGMQVLILFHVEGMQVLNVHTLNGRCILFHVEGIQVLNVHTSAVSTEPSMILVPQHSCSSALMLSSCWVITSSKASWGNAPTISKAQVLASVPTTGKLCSDFKYTSLFMSQ